MRKRADRATERAREPVYFTLPPKGRRHQQKPLCDMSQTAGKKDLAQRMESRPDGWRRGGWQST